MIRSIQTMHLPCIKINNISEQTKQSFHLSLLTLEYNRVRPKWFLSLWCIRHKPYTYLALKLTLSPNRLKQDFIWHMSSRSSIGCVQIDFWAYGTFHANRASYIGSRLALSLNRQNWASTWASSSWSSSIQNGFLDYSALGANCAPILHRN
jgi:hypothetical protein